MESHIALRFTKLFRYLKLRYENLYKLYGYRLCKGKPTPKIAEHKVQYLHFRYLKFLVIDGLFNSSLKAKWEHPLIIDWLTHPNKNQISYAKSDHSSKIQSTMNGFADNPTCEKNPTLRTWISIISSPTNLHPPKEQNKIKVKSAKMLLGRPVNQWTKMMHGDKFTRTQIFKILTVLF